ncbi:histidyl-tRNA synthetase [Jeotgalibacillus malaysiensis]|uniref:Histidine--tRNA ligase n=1 Tax=Jeotgalibacillus malaysiensis TaxID=1508404 RepID=A0A0B5AMU5_9BACL|nr:histidine--tRNA ligase [Jeotgalibacillus malaysiensis]AJD91620.1 histidyl-tRNA synthetase [Jeotgalibacillus malaysiensis]
MAINIPRGTQDILPGVSEHWQYIEQTAAELCRQYQYKEIRTPVFEHTELFERGVGDTTDIVQKEMYTFKDRGDRNLTLRPEGTASVVRSYVQNKMHGQAVQPVKLFYTGPMFRYERPQAGRFRQFVQFGVEAIGSDDPAIDAEVISLAMELYSRLGLKKIKLVLNSLGDTESRIAHKNALIKHFSPRIEEFCSDCQVRLDKNPLRILDCKKDRGHELIESAPSLKDYLNEESQSYFERVKRYLDVMGIEYELDPNLVRGLDYYNHTAFEIMSNAEGFGAITTLCGGGRYNGLTEEIGGPSAPGIGFALSIERLMAALEAEQVTLPINDQVDCYFVAMGEAAKEKAVSLAFDARKKGLSVELDYLNRKMKGQFKAADRINAANVVIIGEDELSAGQASLKNMESGTQEDVSFEDIIEYIKKAQGGK